MGEEKWEGGGALVGREDDERLILNLLDNDLSFQPNAFVTRNYHSLGDGSLEKLGGEGRDSKLLYPHNFSKDSIVTKRRETRGEEGGGNCDQPLNRNLPLLCCFPKVSCFSFEIFQRR